MLHTTFDLLFNKKHDCASQRDRIASSFTGDELAARLFSLSEVKGCGTTTSNIIARYPPFDLKTCPCTFQNKVLFHEYWHMFEAFDRHGILPEAGGYSNQPARILEVFTLLKGLMTDYQVQQQKKKKK